MEDERFYKKKKLLTQRNSLLEDIGLAVFERGNLPENFANLPQEFHSMEILVRQLRDRYRTLREERDRVHIDHEDLMNQMVKSDDESDRKLKPLRNQLNEVSLKIQCLKDQNKRSSLLPKMDESLPLLEEQAKEIRASIGLQEEERNRARRKNRARIDPLAERLERLNRAIRKVQDEEEHLMTVRHRHLRDLGFWYHAHKPGDETFAESYEHLDKLRSELAETPKKTGSGPLLLRKKQESGNWTWFAVLACIAIIIGYRYRTQFRREDIPMAGIAANFLTDAADNRLFADFNRIDRALVADRLPNLEKLPGGSVFRGVASSDLTAILIARNSADEQLKFCGLKFRTPPARFALRLSQDGWKSKKSGLQYRLLVKGSWIWALLNEREFFLFPSGELARFESLSVEKRNESLSMMMRIRPFENNHALLQGFDFLKLTFSDDSFHLMLEALDPLKDAEDRKALFQVRNQERKDPTPPLSLQFSGKRLSISGPRNAYQPLSLQPEQIREFVRSNTAALDRPGNPVEKDVASVKKSAIPRPAGAVSEKRHLLRLFEHRGGRLNLLDDQEVESHVPGVLFLKRERALIVSGGETGSLAKFTVQNNRLKRSTTRLFQGSMPKADEPLSAANVRFNPGPVFPTPDETYVVVLENTPAMQSQPRILLVRTSDMEPFWVEDLPRGIINAYSAAWDDAGQILYIGCRATKRRGDSARTLLVYRRDAAFLRLVRFIEMPLTETPWLQVTDLNIDHAGEALYFLEWPTSLLVHYPLDQTSASVQIPIGPATVRKPTQPMEDTASVRGFRFNRTENLALVTHSPAAAREEGDVLLLVNIKAGGTGVVDSLKLGMNTFDYLRIPLSDRFWISAPESNRLLVASIEDQGLKLEQTHRLAGFRPQYLVCDRLGDLLVVSGTTEAQASPIQ